MSATIVLDIGKTNVKLVLLDRAGDTLASRRMPNAVVRDGPYPHHDTERIWEWMLETMRNFTSIAQVSAIVPVTHGATAVLVDDQGLVLPVLDYEYEPPAGQLEHYSALRPAYASTHSPQLPAGLNLGRQLAWLARSFPADFSRAQHILMYPQYWAWRLSGVAASEVTSLGCHTDLWQPARQQYSSLVDNLGWSELFPPMQAAWAALGAITPEVAAHTGLPSGCLVICGIHDSNASLLRHLQAGQGQPLTVLSTGTWVIAAAIGMPLDQLREEADMLANSNVLGEPVACMRFMGGREFGELAGAEPQVCSIEDLQVLIDQGSMALPCFSAVGGPFAGRAGRIEGPAPQGRQQAYALATLYCVLMSDYCLSALGATGPVVVEGSFTDNPHFAPLLAALRQQQTVASSADTSGTSCGGWMLHHWGETPHGSNSVASPLQLRGWAEYRQLWRALLNGDRLATWQCRYEIT